MLSFDEYRAVEKREKNQKEQDAATAEQIVESIKNRKASDNTNSKTNTSSNNSNTTSGFTIGELLEIYQIQLFVIIMIFLDIFASFLEVHLTASLDASNNSNSGIIDNTVYLTYFDINTTLNILRMFTSFTIFFFFLEIFALLFVFRLNIFSHIGYIIDSCVILLQLYLEVNGSGRESRMLNVFRLWRVARIVNTFVTFEEDKHAITRHELEAKDVLLNKALSEQRRLEGELIKEKDARDSIEGMLAGYKEEVDTLNEALKIAAMDIAEVAQADDDYFVSDDEDDDGDDDGVGGSNVFADAATSNFDKTRNKEVLYREAKAAAAAQADIGMKGSSGGGAVTFVVNDDGSFKQTK